MGRKCSVCEHPKHGEIDRALVEGTVKRASITRRFSVSKDALRRHETRHLQSRGNVDTVRIQEQDEPRQLETRHEKSDETEIETLRKKAGAFDALQSIMRTLSKECSEEETIDRSFVFFVSLNRTHLMFTVNSQELERKLSAVTSRAIRMQQDINDVFCECLEI